MQLANITNPSWLQIAAPSPPQTGPAGSSTGQSQPGQDVTGGLGMPPTALASLQSPGQQFSPSSLNALISAQTASSGVTAQTSPDTSASPSGSQPSATHRHHHHRASGAADAAPDPTDSETTSEPSVGDAAQALAASALAVA